MKNNKNSYLEIVSPIMNNFLKCDVYKFEIEKIDLEIAQSVNEKSIYKALDNVDFKTIRKVRLENEILKLVCKKLKIGNNILLGRDKDIKLIIIDDIKYQIIWLKDNTLPTISNNNNYKKMFFISSTDYKRFYYCGKINTIDSSLLIDNTNVFIGFDKLIID